MLDAITQPEPHAAPNRESHPLDARPDISELKGQLAAARVLAADAEHVYGEKYKELIEALEATRKSWEMMNEEIIAQREQCNSDLHAADAELRQAVITYCQENDTKKFDDQLGVRVMVKLDYKPADATAWAKANAPFMLVADKKEFEKVAKSQDFDFVTKVSSYTAVVATELE